MHVLPAPALVPGTMWKGLGLLVVAGAAVAMPASNSKTGTGTPLAEQSVGIIRDFLTALQRQDGNALLKETRIFMEDLARVANRHILDLTTSLRAGIRKVPNEKQLVIQDRVDKNHNRWTGKVAEASSEFADRLQESVNTTAKVSSSEAFLQFASRLNKVVKESYAFTKNAFADLLQNLEIQTAVVVTENGMKSLRNAVQQERASSAGSHATSVAAETSTAQKSREKFVTSASREGSQNGAIVGGTHADNENKAELVLAGVTANSKQEKIGSGVTNNESNNHTNSSNTKTGISKEETNNVNGSEIQKKIANSIKQLQDAVDGSDPLKNARQAVKDTQEQLLEILTKFQLPNLDVHKAKVREISQETLQDLTTAAKSRAPEQPVEKPQIEQADMKTVVTLQTAEFVNNLKQQILKPVGIELPKSEGFKQLALKTMEGILERTRLQRHDPSNDVTAGSVVVAQKDRSTGPVKGTASEEKSDTQGTNNHVLTLEATTVASKDTASIQPSNVPERNPQSGKSSYTGSQNVGEPNVQDVPQWLSWLQGMLPQAGDVWNGIVEWVLSVPKHTRNMLQELMEKYRPAE